MMHKSRFILPNLFTSLNFLLGVWSILLATGIFQPGKTPPVILAAHFVIFCVLLDKLDGFAAKLMKASSAFGAQFDSLADLIAFGLAPAFAMFFTYSVYVPTWFESSKPMLSVSLSLYVLCAALRLAKFNAIDSESHPDYFVGMPSTLSGAFNALLLIIVYKNGFFYESNPWLPMLPLCLTGTAILMVAPLFLPKLKTRKNKLINFAQVIGILTAYVFGFAMIAEEFLFSLVLIYAVVGFTFGWIKKGDIMEYEQSDSSESQSA